LESSALPTQLHWLHIAHLSDFDPSLAPTCAAGSICNANPQAVWVFEVVDYGIDVGIFALSNPFFASEESPVGISFIVYLVCVDWFSFWTFMLAVHFNTTSFCFYLNLIRKILEILAQSLARLPVSCSRRRLPFKVRGRSVRFDFLGYRQSVKSLKELAATFAT
jgi:hypothetical protein